MRCCCLMNNDESTLAFIRLNSLPYTYCPKHEELKDVMVRNMMVTQDRITWVRVPRISKHQQFQDIDSPNLCLQIPVACESVIETPSKTKLFCKASSIFEGDSMKNEAILRDFRSTFELDKRQKRSKSARLPQFLKLATPKTKQFCEISFKNGKLSAELTASCQCVLRFVHSMSLKYRACHEKVRPGPTKSCACHTKSSSRNWRFDAPKCNLCQEISARTS